MLETDGWEANDFRSSSIFRIEVVALICENLKTVPTIVVMRAAV